MAGVLLLAGCEKEYEAPEDQPVFFEYRYVNYAWSYSEHGWLINADGDVRRYDLPDDFRLPDSTGYISAEDLIHNLSQTELLIGSIEANDLDHYVGLIPGAADGEILKSQNVMADAGSSVLSCYLYDSDRDMYQYVFLASSGDWEQLNDSREAEILVDWLKEIGEVFWFDLFSPLSMLQVTTIEDFITLGSHT